jgi:hypothetical protein
VNTGHHRLIVGFDFVRRVDQHQAATGNRRQLGFQLLIAIGFFTRRGCLSGIQNAAAGSRSGAVRSAGCPARAAAGGQSAESRVVAQLAVAVEVVHHADVRLQLGRQVVLLPDAGDPFQIFTGTLGMLAAQLITARARVGVQIEKRFSFSLSDSMIRL